MKNILRKDEVLGGLIGGGRVLVGVLGGTSERCDEFDGCKTSSATFFYTFPAVYTD